MKYIYTVEDCPYCKALKNKYKADNIVYVERKIERLANDPRIFDGIDKAAFAVFGKSQTFPVEVEDE